jgi:hypothetical protein
MIAAARPGSQTDLASVSSSSNGSITDSKPAARAQKSRPSPTHPKRPEPPTSHPRVWLGNLRRPKTSSHAETSPLVARSVLADDDRRDSALVPASPAPTTNTTASTIPEPPPRELSRVTSLPTIVVHGSHSHDVPSPRDEMPGSAGPNSQLMPQSNDNATPDFFGITTLIPTGSLDDLLSPDKMQFSNRGSVLLDGKRAAVLAEDTARTPPATPNRLHPKSSLQMELPVRDERGLSLDERELSQKVRSMYEFGREDGADFSDRSLTAQTLVEEEGDCETPLGGSLLSVNTIQTAGHSIRSSPSFSSRRESFIPREPHEKAGGIEDWEDIQGDEVDRYGFILARKSESRASNHSGAGPESTGLHRVSTALAEASETPRRRRTIRRAPSKARHSQGPQRRPSKRSLQPNGSIRSFRSTSSFSVTQNPLRYASNRLPQNKERRWMDEASDMLTLPPGLAELEANIEGGAAVQAMKKKEWQREEKWRQMGKILPGTAKGGGMRFDFDPKDPKVISRTWKGIPDKWRSSAWYSFLAASAKRNKACQAEEELVNMFYDLQEENSADDVQIDCDVPRTINRHIMFRRRYRGGQRLLFRVLHALSLYFPNTGYVQGMATLAATLLCYYDEEQAFVMMVRLWQLRGLDRLYESGFGGLMEALEEFEKLWLCGGDVAKKLVSLITAGSRPKIVLHELTSGRRKNLESPRPLMAHGGT